MRQRRSDPARARKRSLSADPALVAELVTANKILFAHGVVDAFGHVSARHDKMPDRFLLARNMAPALVTAADFMEFDLDGNPVAADGRSVYLERFIHAEVYRARAEVMAVVHIRNAAGRESDLLIRDSALGAALASSLGPHCIVLMRGHGATVVGASVREAVFRAVYTEVNARLQLEALRLGAITYLTPEESIAAARSVGGQINRAWDLWRARC
jgi:HCOMODA/2-hydroxy-3-carboxy-muconic semialdehyde decarboxylase